MEQGRSARSLSVVITTRNRSELLREALASVVAQDPSDLDLEIIVIDDRSTDDTETVVRSFEGVRYARVSAGSCGASRAAGIELAKGTWIAFLDDDDTWLPRVPAFAELTRKRPELRMVWSPAIVCDHLLKERGAVWPGPELDGTEGMFEAFLRALPAPSSIFVHREVFERCGSFSPSAGRAEDWDFFLRVARAGFPSARLAEPSVLYRSRVKPDAKLILQTAKDSLDIVARELEVRHSQRPTRLARARAVLRLRGWHVHAMLDGARHRDTSPEERRALRLAALRLSPLHVVAAVLRREA